MTDPENSRQSKQCRQYRTRVSVAVAVVWMTCGVCSAAIEGEPDAPAKTDLFVTVEKQHTVDFQPTSAERLVPERFRQSAHSFTASAEFTRMSGPVRVFRVRFPSPVKTDVAENNTAHGDYFQPQGKGPHPGCVMLHVAGGEFALSQMIANSLARRGVATLFIKMPYYGERRGKKSPRRMISFDPETTVENMTQAVLDARRAAAWLGNRPEVDADRLGVTGISLGGIMSALSAEAEPRFRKVAIYLGGGNLAAAIWTHPDTVVERFRQYWVGRGGSRESLQKILAPVDPVTYGHLLEDRTVLMVAAKNDEIVLPEFAIALWESIAKKPQLVWLDSGHITAAQYILGEVERLGRFFEQGPSEAAKPKAASK